MLGNRRDEFAQGYLAILEKRGSRPRLFRQFAKKAERCLAVLCEFIQCRSELALQILPLYGQPLAVDRCQDRPLFRQDSPDPQKMPLSLDVTQMPRIFDGRKPS